MTVGMYGASLVATVNQLLFARFATGLGIGGMLASTNAMTAEFSNAKYRNLAVILMATGYPVGAMSVVRYQRCCSELRLPCDLRVRGRMHRFHAPRCVGRIA